MSKCFEGISENNMIEILYKKILIIELKNLLLFAREETNQITSIKNKILNCVTDPAEIDEINELIKNTIITNRITFLKGRLSDIIPYFTLTLSLLKYTELPADKITTVTQTVNNTIYKTLGNMSNYINGTNSKQQLNQQEQLHKEYIDKRTKTIEKSTVSLIQKTREIVLNTTYVKKIVNILTDPLGRLNSENFKKIEELAYLLHYIAFCIILITAANHENFLNDIFDHVTRGFGLTEILKFGGKPQKKKKKLAKNFDLYVKKIIKNK